MIIYRPVKPDGKFVSLSLHRLLSKNMISQIETQEVHFNKAIEPFKIMLIDRKVELSKHDWLNLVHRTKEGILTQPDQYLGKELPDADTLTMIVEKFFSDFLQQQN